MRRLDICTFLDRSLQPGGVIRLLLICLISIGPLLATPVQGQVISMEDVSPDSSTLDPLDPNGATGGRVNGIAVDPNNPLVLYAASEWGGIYKSTDGGDTWARLDGHRPTVTWDVAVDPGNSARLYATSFYDGRLVALSGINVSIDGGAFWHRPFGTIPPVGFCAHAADQTELTAFGIGIDPSNNNNVYIGTSCGMAISDDGGGTWTYTSPVPGAGRIWDLVVSADGSWVDTCGDDGYWFYSVQSEAWGGGSGLPSGRCSIAASPYSSGNENMIAVVGLSIYETENSGATWTRTRINPSSQGRIPFVATNRRSTAPMGTKFDLWFGDVSLYSVQCDKNAVGPSCGVDNTPAWEGPYTRTVGGHDDMGGILFDPSAANDACPILMSSDGGVYRNLEVTHPECQSPIWEQPSVSPHGLWLFAMDGADRLGATSEDLYFGNQDNGVFGATDAGAASPTWVNAECCDGFDTAADDAGAGSVIFSVCCGGDPSTSFLQAGAGFTGSREIDYPPVGQSPEWTYPDSIVNWGDNKYAMVTWGFRPETRGVFITENADESPIVWTELGDAPSGCAIYAGTADGVPTFYIQTGSCNADKTTDRVFKFTGTDPAGSWSEIVLPSGGFGIFTVSKSDPDLLLASGFTDTNAFMYKSTDGGASWISPPRLDSLMRGGGDFPIRNSRGPTDFTGMLGYHQPSLVAIDPTDPTLMIAGGRDSGIFFSTDGGSSWSLVTDPRDSHTSGIPHIPRPRFAYFDEEPGGAKDVYIGSQGRGIWRFKVSEGCVDDEYESLGSGNTDDSCWGASLGGLPATQTHLHCDEDWVYFQAEQGRTYEIETGNLVGGSDTTLSLAAGCGPEQVFDDNGGPGLASFLRWTADRSDFADLRIRQSADAYGAGKAYDITVREVCLTDLVLADMAVSAAVTFVADSTIATGPNFLVEATGSASLIAGNSVVFSSPTTVEGELTVNLAPSPCPSDPALLFESSVKEVERRKSRNGGGAGRGIWAF